MATVIVGANSAFQVTTKIIEFSGTRTRAKAGSQQSPNRRIRELEAQNQSLAEENEQLRREGQTLRSILAQVRADARARAAGASPIDLAVNAILAERTSAPVATSTAVLDLVPFLARPAALPIDRTTNALASSANASAASATIATQRAEAARSTRPRDRPTFRRRG